MHLQNKRIFICLLFAIFFLATFLRFYQLSSYPVGFHIDEANLGYNGYSLLQTGKDDSGHKFPLYISMFDDNNPTGYHYLTIPTIALFGLSEFAVRFPAALFGSLSVFAFFALVYAFLLDKRIALFGSFLLAVSPWHIGMSRGSAETLVALFFVMLGFAGVIYGIRSHTRLYIVSGTLSLIISFFIYPTPRVFVPLLFLTIILFLFKILYKGSRKVFTYTVGSFLVVALTSFLLVFIITGGTGRFSQVSIFNTPGTKLVLLEQISEESGLGKHQFLARVFHNKIINYTQTFTKNYFEYFSGEFLFISGGYPHLVRIPWMGELYILALPFLLLGVIVLFLKKDVYAKIPFLWILFAPVVAAMTVDDIPNVRRVLVLLPMFELLVACGFFYAYELVKKEWKKIYIISISILFLCNFAYFLNQYFIQATVHLTWYRNNGFDTMIQYVKEHYEEYDHFIITKDAGGMYPLILFYMKYDPALYQMQGSPRNPDFGGFGKFFFVPHACPSENHDDRFPLKGKVLYVNRGDCPDSKNIKFYDISRQDGTRAFRLHSDTYE